MSEQLLLINPRKKAKRPKRRRVSAKRRPTAANVKRAYVSGSGPIRRLKINPRRRRFKYIHKVRPSHWRRVQARNAGKFALNPRRRRRHRINPRLPSLGGVTSMAKSIGVPLVTGVAGAAAIDLAWGYGSSYLPASLQSGTGATAAKAGSAVVLALVASKFVGRQRAMSGLLGALLAIGYGPVRDWIAKTFPTVKGFGGYADYVDYTQPRDYSGMGAYMRPQLGYISPAPVLQQHSGVGAYMLSLIHI